MLLVTGPFFPVCFLNQWWTPSLRFQVPHCSAFRSMCDVPSIAVFCKESIGCVPGIACRFFFKLRVPIPVAPIITGMIVHFRFHIRYYYYYYYYVNSVWGWARCVTNFSVLWLEIMFQLITRLSALKSIQPSSNLFIYSRLLHPASLATDFPPPKIILISVCDLLLDIRDIPYKYVASNGRIFIEY